MRHINFEEADILALTFWRLFISAPGHFNKGDYGIRTFGARVFGGRLF